MSLDKIFTCSLPSWDHNLLWRKVGNFPDLSMSSLGLPVYAVRETPCPYGCARLTWIAETFQYCLQNPLGKCGALKGLVIPLPSQSPSPGWWWCRLPLATNTFISKFLFLGLSVRLERKRPGCEWPWISFIRVTSFPTISKLASATMATLTFL